MKTSERLEIQVTRLVDRLPPMPDNINFLLHKLSNDFQQEKELVKLAEQDPGLCTDLTNSFSC